MPRADALVRDSHRLDHGHRLEAAPDLVPDPQSYQVPSRFSPLQLPYCPVVIGTGNATRIGNAEEKEWASKFTRRLPPEQSHQPWIHSSILRLDFHLQSTNISYRYISPGVRAISLRNTRDHVVIETALLTKGSHVLLPTDLDAVLLVEHSPARVLVPVR